MNDYTPTTGHILEAFAWDERYDGLDTEKMKQFDRWLAEVKAKEREDCVNHVKFLYCSHSMEYKPYQEAVDDIVEVLTGKEDGSDVFDRWLAELIRMAKADGFDEGWDARVNAETITPTENPYRQGEEHTHTKRSSFGDPYCKTCGIDLEGEEQ